MTDGSLVGTLLRMVVSTLVVLALLILLARYLQRRQVGGGAGRVRRQQATAVELVARHGLTRGASVAVVRVGGQTLLLGVTDSSVQVLRELEEPEAPSAVAQPAPKPALDAPVHPALALVEGLRDWTARRG